MAMMTIPRSQTTTELAQGIYPLSVMGFTKEELIKAVEDKQVTVRKHPLEKLFIFNYSPLVQYNRQWNDVTKACRGLILNDDYKVVARPFHKIFNYTEIVPDQVIFQQPPVVTDKLDGSLGIIYKGREGWQVATRGSFTSEQAIWATQWLQKNFPNYEQPLSVTTLVEIIYPENRICVDYGQRAELVLIGAINKLSGSDIPLKAAESWWQGAVVDQVLGATNIDDIYLMATSNDFEGKEGVVCTWYKFQQPSFRLKVKHPEYVRLHKVISNFSAKRVWEFLSNGEDFLGLLTKVPDEFYALVKDIIKEFYENFASIDNLATDEFNKIKHIENRKAFAEVAKTMTYPSIMFAMKDGKEYHQQIWKMLKPKEQDD